MISNKQSDILQDTLVNILYDPTISNVIEGRDAFSGGHLVPGVIGRGLGLLPQIFIAVLKPEMLVCDSFDHIAQIFKGDISWNSTGLL